MKIVLFLPILLIAVAGRTQLKTKFNQYMLHQMVFNPGYVDPETKFSANFIYRRQWLKQENFPEAAYLYGHYNINENNGVGLLINNDLFNKFNQFEIAANYVYNIPFGYDFNLGLGVKLGFNEQHLLNQNLTYFDPVEPTLAGQTYTNRFVNVGGGVSISSSTFNFHLSLPYVFGNNMMNPAKNYQVKSNHLYSSIGYKFRFSDWFILYPSAMLNGVRGSRLHAAVNVNALYGQLFWCGLGLDSDYTANVSVGLFTMSGFRIIYTYDDTYFTKHQVTGASHEFSLSYGKTIKNNPFKKKRFSRSKLFGRGFR